MSSSGNAANAFRATLRSSLSAYPIVLVGLTWQIATKAGWVNPAFLPPLDQVFVELVKLLLNGQLPSALFTSLICAVLGVAAAMVFGVAIGFLMAEMKSVRWLFSSFVLLGFPMPKIALIPVFTLWFGIDSQAKIALVIVTCVFPFIISSRTAASSVSTNLRWAAQSLGTSSGSMFRYVIFPATIPSLISGLRVAFPIGLITVFTAEMVGGGGGGVGGAIVQAQRYFDTVTVFAYILVTLVVGYLTDRLLVLLQHRLAGW